MKLVRAHAYLGYLAVALWFLLTVLAPARADEAAPGAVVLRAADLIPDIEAALAGRGAPADAAVILEQPEAEIAFGAGAQIDHVSYNPASGRFVVRFTGANGPVAIAGAARAPQLAAAPVRAIARGERIAAADIALIETSAPLPRGAAADASRLVGMEARRDLAAGQPIRAHDVAAPVLVRRGALVTMTFQSGGVRLTHAAVALADGAAGDVIDVRNVRSDRVVKAVVSGDDVVSALSVRRDVKHAEM